VVAKISWWTQVLYLSEIEKIEMWIIAFEIVTFFVVCLLHLWLFIANNPMESTIATHPNINLSLMFDNENESVFEFQTQITNGSQEMSYL
jgi:hypothetical protein